MAFLLKGECGRGGKCPKTLTRTSKVCFSSAPCRLGLKPTGAHQMNHSPITTSNNIRDALAIHHIYVPREMKPWTDNTESKRHKAGRFQPRKSRYRSPW